MISPCLVLLAIALIILRKDKGLPQKDEFKVPFVPVLPIISIIVCLSFMSQYSWQTWLAFGLAVLIGSVIYAFTVTNILSIKMKMIVPSGLSFFDIMEGK